MSTMIEKVIAEINKRFDEQGGEITLTMKVNGDKVIIANFLHYNTVYDVYFDAYSRSDSTQSLQELAEWLINYPAHPDKLREEDNRWLAENEPKVREYFHKYFEGKSMAQINAEQDALRRAYDDGKRGSELPDVGDWDWYSDWHKSVFNYRPHGVVCGVYVRPY